MKDVLAPFSSTAMPSSRASNGGQMQAKPIANYKPPVGPKNNSSPGPGLKGGTNHGCCGTQGKR